MKSHALIRLLPLAALLTVCCNSSEAVDPPRQPEEPAPAEEYDLPDAVHLRERDRPYPREEHTLFINPSALVVPQAERGDGLLQFALARDERFDEASTLLSEARPWCICNPHRELDEGTWYWRFRRIDDAGTGPWSDIYSFTVTGREERFVTPAFADFRDNLPMRHPRLDCFLDDGLEEARQQVASHREYKSLMNRANGAVGKDYSVGNPYDRIAEIKRETYFLYTAYLLTQEEKYTAQMLATLRAMLAYPIADKQLFASNFGSTDIIINIIEGYDLLYDRLTVAERSAAEALILRVARKYYLQYRGKQENQLFDNHFWQHNMRVLFQCAFMLYDRAEYAQEALEMLEYYYELWTARAPDSGYNLSGVWRNGAYYFDANIQTLYYLPMLFGHLTGGDFLAHPWYRNAGQALLYTWPPESKSAGFGDGAEESDAPVRVRIAFADFLARELGDAYAGWYARTCAETLADDYLLRLYRIVRDASAYDGSLPANAPKYLWYRDAGEVVMHSKLTAPAENTTLSFRSSPFGSGSHTQSDQNSFNLLYGGQEVFARTGYYLNFSDAHNVTSYRHTRAHNTLLVDGIGQPFSTKAYGYVPRATGGESITYCLGDASQAYRGENDTMWADILAGLGIAPTAENGFGPTPLTRYKRHVAMLHPDLIVIYDELAASEPVRWDWLLHSPVRFSINAPARRVTTLRERFAAQACWFCDDDCTMQQTDRFVVPPDMSLADPGQECPDQWHLTLSFGPSAASRILTLIQIIPSGSTARTVTREGNEIRCGSWRITAEFSSERPAALSIRDTDGLAVLSYGTEHPVIDGAPYVRRQAGSTILYDCIDGAWRTVELTDEHPIATRANDSQR